MGFAGDADDADAGVEPAVALSWTMNFQDDLGINHRDFFRVSEAAFWRKYVVNVQGVCSGYLG